MPSFVYRIWNLSMGIAEPNKLSKTLHIFYRV